MNEDILQINMPEPHYYQKLAIYYASQESDCEILTQVAGRRGGKSGANKHIITEWFKLAPNLKIWYVSYTDNQTKEFYYSYLQSISKTGLVKKTKQDKGNYSITFYNDSVCEFKSSKSENSLRGGDGVDFLICDEFAFYKKEIFSRIIYPQLATVRNPDLKKKIVLSSSPLGKTNDLYKYFQFGQSDEPAKKSFESIQYNIFDNPSMDESFVTNAKITMTTEQYNREILGQFTDSGGVFNYVNECAVIMGNQEFDPQRQYYLGIDIGLKVDNTVLTIVSSRPGSNNLAVQVNAQYTFSNTLSTDIEDIIYNLNLKWKFKKILIEDNSAGLPIMHSLIVRHKMYNVEGKNTNMKTKPEMVNQLAHLFNNKNIDIINDENLIDELNDFIITFEEGKIKYAGLEHDDRVMSLCIAVECWSKNRSSGEYYVKVLR